MGAAVGPDHPEPPHGSIQGHGYDLRSAAASRASAVMRAKSPATIAPFGATHEPPTAITFGVSRYAAAFVPSMPPVTQKRRSGSGAATDLSQAMPPDACAGKNFST